MMDEYIKREDVLQHKRKMRCADFHGGFWDFIVLCEDIERIPAAEVAEVRHGEWNECECSVCGQPSPTLYMDDFELKYRIVKTQYCPNCGAKMDGKGEGE